MRQSVFDSVAFLSDIESACQHQEFRFSLESSKRDLGSVDRNTRANQCYELTGALAERFSLFGRGLEFAPYVELGQDYAQAGPGESSV